MVYAANQHGLSSRDYYDDGESWRIPLDVLIRLIIYAAFVAVLMMMAALIIKLMANLVSDDGGSSTETPSSSETNSLLPKEVIPFTYGTCDQEDLECGDSHFSSSSSSEDLYDGKICVICYDEPRSCFFIPCGHCITCHSCAKRIVNEESRTCPICRIPIEKVNTVFLS